MPRPTTVSSTLSQRHDDKCNAMVWINDRICTTNEKSSSSNTNGSVFLAPCSITRIEKDSSQSLYLFWSSQQEQKQEATTLNVYLSQLLEKKHTFQATSHVQLESSSVSFLCCFWRCGFSSRKNQWLKRERSCSDDGNPRQGGEGCLLFLQCRSRRAKATFGSSSIWPCLKWMFASGIRRRRHRRRHRLHRRTLNMSAIASFPATKCNHHHHHFLSYLKPNSLPDSVTSSDSVGFPNKPLYGLTQVEDKHAHAAFAPRRLEFYILNNSKAQGNIIKRNTAPLVILQQAPPGIRKRDKDFIDQQSSTVLLGNHTRAFSIPPAADFLDSQVGKRDYDRYSARFTSSSVDSQIG
jgi:hypothetical protein